MWLDVTAHCYLLARWSHTTQCWQNYPWIQLGRSKISSLKPCTRYAIHLSNVQNVFKMSKYQVSLAHFLAFLLFLLLLFCAGPAVWQTRPAEPCFAREERDCQRREAAGHRRADQAVGWLVRLLNLESFNTTQKWKWCGSTVVAPLFQSWIALNFPCFVLQEGIVCINVGCGEAGLSVHVSAEGAGGGGAEDYPEHWWWAQEGNQGTGMNISHKAGSILWPKITYWTVPTLLFQRLQMYVLLRLHPGYDGARNQPPGWWPGRGARGGRVRGVWGQQQRPGLPYRRRGNGGVCRWQEQTVPAGVWHLKFFCVLHVIWHVYSLLWTHNYMCIWVYSYFVFVSM